MNRLSENPPINVEERSQIFRGERRQITDFGHNRPKREEHRIEIPDNAPSDYNNSESPTCVSPIAWLFSSNTPLNIHGIGSSWRSEDDLNKRASDNSTVSDYGLLNTNVSRNNGVISRTPLSARAMNSADSLLPLDRSSNISLNSPQFAHQERKTPFSLTSPATYLNDDVQESRIIAPNVGKLAPYSVIEIRLKSDADTVAVLCSVDVLKMRSAFFGEVLDLQEKNFDHILSNEIWREPLTILESSPFEAAAFLEALHDGRTSLFQEEWNHTWARLTVDWLCDELMQDFVNQIERHFSKLFNLIKNKSWRTSPSVFAGYRIAFIKKNDGLIPTVAVGTVTEGTTAGSLNYSKVRVVLDEIEANQNGLESLLPHLYPYSAIPKVHCSPVGNTPQSPAGPPAGARISIPPPSRILTYEKTTPTTPLEKKQNTPERLCEVLEPFWVLQQNTGQQWLEPDELFAVEMKNLITAAHKKVFWEMVRSVIDHPKLALKLANCDITNAKDLSFVLKRPEYRILWTTDAPQYLPKETASDLIAAAYCGGRQSFHICI